MLRKFALSIAVVAVLALFLVACGSGAAPTTAPAPAQPTSAPAPAQPTTAPPAAKAQLSMIWFQWQPCQAMGELVKQFPDATVDVRCVPIAQWHDQIFTDFAAKGGADLVVLDSQYIGEAVVGGHVLEMTDWMKSNLNINDFVPAAMQAYGEYPFGSGHYWGVPGITDTMMLIYRKDLFGDAKVQADYKAATGNDLKVPQTWTELLKQAQFFSASNGKYDVKYGYSAIWKGKGGYDEVSTETNQILWSFGGEIWDPKTYKIDGVLNSPTNVKTLDFIKQLFKTSPPGAGDFSFSEMIDALCNGSTAIGNVWFAFGATFVDPKSCKYSDKLGYGIVPGEVKHVLSLGGQGLHVSAYTKNKDAALAFIKWFESKPIQEQWVKLGAQTGRKDVLTEDLYLNATPFNKYFADSYPLSKDFWNLPEYNEMLQIQQENINLAASGQMDSQAALDTIAKKQQAILDKAYPNGPPK